MGGHNYFSRKVTVDRKTGWMHLFRMNSDPAEATQSALEWEFKISAWKQKNDKHPRVTSPIAYEMVVLHRTEN
jgi:hypothetical protein